jgi:hypothetical protein
VQEYEEYKALKLERLRREVKIGIDQIERGEVGDGGEARDVRYFFRFKVFICASSLIRVAKLYY